MAISRRSGDRSCRMILVLALLLAAVPAAAQVEFEVNYGVIGLNGLAVIHPAQVYRGFDEAAVRPGGDAMGAGGAWLARADGLTAIGWSPAGLARMNRAAVTVDGYSLGSSGSVSGYPSQILVPQQPPLTLTGHNVRLKGGVRANFLAFGTPIWNSGDFRVVGAVSWRRYANIAVPEESVSDLFYGDERNFPVVLSVDRAEKGALEAFAPSVAVQIRPGIEVGANFNFLTGRLRANGVQRLTTGGFPLEARQILRYKYSGFVPDIGVRLDLLADHLRLAGRWSPGYTLEVTNGRIGSSSFVYPGAPVVHYTGKVAHHDLEIPSALGVGAAVRPLERLWISSDLNIHNWSETALIYRERPGDAASLNDRSLPYRDVTSFHLGAEFLLFRPDWADIPVRVGFRTAPQSVAETARGDVVVDTVETYLGRHLTVSRVGPYRGEQVTANAWTIGASLRMDHLSYDVGMENLSYEMNRWYFDTPYDALANPDMAIVKEKRRIRLLRLSVTHDF